MNQQSNTALQETDPLALQDELALGRLSESLGFLLSMAHVEIVSSLNEELGQHGLKPGEFSVFWLINQYPGVRQGLIARRLSIKLAHMTKLVRGLEKRGFVERKIPDTDRRSVLLTLTNEGRAFLESCQDDFFGHFFAKNNALSEAELGSLITLLQKFTGIQEGPSK